MSDDFFGDDDGPDDQYDASGARPDTHQVAVRFHEERVRRGLTTDANWEDLSDELKDIGDVIGAIITERALDGESPREIARFLDDLGEYLNRDRPHVFNRHRQAAAIEAVLRNLQREGTLL